MVVGGSPCQDLSVAGKRAGLDGARSGLFMEQIRIIKELRNECVRQIQMQGADELVRPRWMVWENVVGAFSSNDGEDFRIVLEETARIADETAVIPKPPKGKWSFAGCIVGDGWSLAWRTTDNQFWGTPQRRRRIALVADFGGERAAEILFERNSLSGDSAESGQEGEGTSETLERHTYEASSYTLKVRGGAEFDRYGKRAGKGALIQTELSGTLGVSQDQTLITLVEGINGDVAGTLDANYYKGCGEREGTEREVVCIGNGQVAQAAMSNQVGALNCMHDQQAVMVYGLDRASFNQGQNAQYDFAVEEELAPTVLAKGPGGY